MLVVPPTTMVKVLVPPIFTPAVVGEIVMVTGFTVTVADAVFVLSTMLFAVTVQVVTTVTEDGAVYEPILETVPQPVAGLTDQVTPELLTVPLMEALNCWLLPTDRVALVGDMVTTIEFTVTVADADFVLSALLVAVTVQVAAELGAV